MKKLTIEQVFDLLKWGGFKVYPLHTTIFSTCACGKGDVLKGESISSAAIRIATNFLKGYEIEVDKGEFGHLIVKL